MRLLAVLLTTATLSLAPAAHAATIFDFESEIAGNKGNSYAITKNGLTMTITRIGGKVVEVASRQGYPSSWGRLALSPFLDTSAGAIQLSFSKAITSISVDAGDFAPSDADNFLLTAGSASDSDSQLASTGFPNFATLSLDGLNTFTATLSGGSASFAESVFWDNITVTTANAVPIQGTLGLALGSLGLMAWRRRRC